MVSRSGHASTLVLALGLVLASAPDRAQTKPDSPGLVDGTRLVELVGEDSVRLRVSLGGSILRAIAAGSDDSDLQSLVTGLESIYALILDLGDPEHAARARKGARDLEAELRRKGWEELAFVQEEGSTVRVLIRSQGERVRGLVAILIDTSDDEPALVFANVAGTLDLGRLQELGAGLNVPGLKDLQLPERPSPQRR